VLDLQNEKDERNLPLDKVGVKGVKYPVMLRDKEKGVQYTIAEVSMYVDLPLHFRGTHMSRFIEILHEHAQNIDLRNLKALLQDMKNRLSASKAHLDLSFPYVIEKKTPITDIPCFMVIQCTYRAALDGNERFTLIYGITVPVQTVCPCSKAISSYGAHNQRASVTIQIVSKKLIWIEDLVKIAETGASSSVYPLLKREDEKFVTEQGYEHAKFVEDVVRDICLILQNQESVLWFSIETRSMESIHDHDAFAYIEWGKLPC
jgi:GTP cyclohydrolase I